MSIIFVRERRKVEKGEKKPRFRVVAVQGSEVKIKADHFRKRELEMIAEATGSDVVYLEVEGAGKKGQDE